MIERYALGALGGLLALIAAYFYGAHVGKAQVRAQVEAAAVVALRQGIAHIEQVHAAVDQADAAVARIDVARQQSVREIYREIPTIIRGDPVYRNVCIGDDGVHALDRAAAVANGEPAGSPVGSAAGPAGNPTHH